MVLNMTEEEIVDFVFTRTHDFPFHHDGTSFKQQSMLPFGTVGDA